ncbi:MAG: transcriptional repressor LexA [Myxococcota bacterium]|nr:transcriptional repressor LexA [Myxococcota bacterium]MEC8381444.1 transcriptional repressor LexA [Myxococcota bacterium]
MEDLSKRQREVLDYIQSRILHNNIPPTYREIGDALGISSTNGVSDHVKALIKKGYIRKVSSGSGAARGLILTEKSSVQRSDTVIDVPLIGTVAAGAPILAEESYERTLRLDASMADTSAPVYALRVRGDSMINAGIYEDDIVIVRQTQSNFRPGDIVVALIDGEATVKYFFRESNRICLQPANDHMKPIYIDPTQNSLIQGVVIGLYRQY